jgi:hypothetical protein
MHTGSSKSSARQKAHGVTTGQRTDLFGSAPLTCLFPLSRMSQGRYRGSWLRKQSEAMTICVCKKARGEGVGTTSWTAPLALELFYMYQLSERGLLQA